MKTALMLTNFLKKYTTSKKIQKNNKLNFKIDYTTMKKYCIIYLRVNFLRFIQLAIAEDAVRMQ